MRTIVSGLTLLLASALLSGCQSYIPFNNEHRSLLQDNLENVQFYISDTIYLSRKVRSQEKIIEDSTRRLRLKKHSRYLEIVIPRHTPGVVKRIKGDTLYVQFERCYDKKERLIPFKRVRKYAWMKDKSSPEDYIYVFKASRVVYEDDIFKVSYLQKEVPVDEQDTSSYARKVENQEGRHRIVKTLFPVLLVDFIERKYSQEEYRRASGVKVGH